MSAEEKRGLNKVDKLAVIAGGGDLPRKLIKSCREDNIELFIIAFEGNTDIETVEGTDHIWTDLGAAKKNINALKKRDIKHLVFCGSIKRPSFKGMKPDWKAARFLTKVGLKALGDDGLLTAVRKELEKEGMAPKDDVHRALQKVQEATDDCVRQIDAIIEGKEQEILED